MDAKTVKEFKGLINQKIELLLRESEETAHEMNDQDIKFADPSDRGTMEAERNLMLRIRDRERKLIAKMKKALLRLEEGSYGLCEECGEPIGLDRLRARPETTQCIDCKEENELREKRVKEIGRIIMKNR